MSYSYRLQLKTNEEGIRDLFHSLSDVELDIEHVSDSNGLGTGMKRELENVLTTISNTFPDVEFKAHLSYWNMKILDTYEIKGGKIKKLESWPKRNRIQRK